MTTFAIQPGPPDRGVCRGCGSEILWVRTVNDKAMCLDRLETQMTMDGTLLVDSSATHWSTCPKRAKFTKPKVRV